MVASLHVVNNPDPLTGSRGFSPSSCSPGKTCGNGLEKVYPTCAVRYGYMSYIGEFRYAPGMLFGCGAKVVIQSERGIEIGQQVSLTCSGCDKSIKRNTMLDYVKSSGQDFLRPKSGRILRTATNQDLDEEKHINREADSKLRRARELAAQNNLPIKIVTCEHLFGGERIIFHFMSEQRVDFRDLVRDLAHEYHTRIEMHQVGARDEARLVADYEICGRECCCKNFLKTLRPITMRMAKLQKATLDPSKVSGRCGRLRCCLRYEHENYEDMNKRLARVGTRVQTDRGIGTVTDRQILTQLLSIQYDADHFIETVGAEFVTLADRVTDRPPPLNPEAKGPDRGVPRQQNRPIDRNDRRPSGNPPGPTSPPSFPPQQQQQPSQDSRSNQSNADQGRGDGHRGRHRHRRGRRDRQGPRLPGGPEGPPNRDLPGQAPPGPGQQSND